MSEKTQDFPIKNSKGKKLRACLCWNCGRLCACPKEFPNGRPKRRSECSDYTEAPPEPTRITRREMAEVLGCTLSRIEQLSTSAKGVRFLTKALARRGVAITYELKENRIYFYKEELKK